MKLIGYRFKSHEEECWAYTYDLKGVRRGKGIKEYGYVEPVYVDDERNYVQVEIPKVPQWVAKLLDESYSTNYDLFKSNYKEKSYSAVDNRGKSIWVYENKHVLDLAMALGVWEIK